jgi:hypothetical protein
VKRKITPELALAHGYYPVTDVRPAYDPATEKLTGPASTFSANQITRTWGVAALTAEEQNQYAAQAMDRNLCMFIKLLKTQGKLTNADVQAAPPALKAAFLAADALGECGP